MTGRRRRRPAAAAQRGDSRDLSPTPPPDRFDWEIVTYLVRCDLFGGPTDDVAFVDFDLTTVEVELVRRSGCIVRPSAAAPPKHDPASIGTAQANTTDRASIFWPYSTGGAVNTGFPDTVIAARRNTSQRRKELVHPSHPPQSSLVNECLTETCPIGPGRRGDDCRHAQPRSARFVKRGASPYV